MAGATNRWDEQVNNPGARHETAAHYTILRRALRSHTSTRNLCPVFGTNSGTEEGIGCGLDPSES